MLAGQLSRGRMTTPTLTTTPLCRRSSMSLSCHRVSSSCFLAFRLEQAPFHFQCPQQIQP